MFKKAFMHFVFVGILVAFALGDSLNLMIYVLTNYTTGSILPFTGMQGHNT